MKKQLLLLISLITFLISCNKSNVQFFKYTHDEWSLSIDIPQSMCLTKTDNYSLQFEGNQRIVKILRAKPGDKWNLEKFANSIVGSNGSQLTLNTKNDTLIAYEISKGLSVIPAHIFSIHSIEGFSILVFTYGFSVETHINICNSITISTTKNTNDFTSYSGDYMNLDYPSNWYLNENPHTETADVYIGQNDNEFGLWLFCFKLENGYDFKGAMNELANNWRELGQVNIEYEMINGNEWCKHDIKLNIQGQEGRQISYYAYKDNVVYNIKFGNKSDLVSSNLGVIRTIMNSVEIK